MVSSCLSLLFSGAHVCWHLVVVQWVLSFYLSSVLRSVFAFEKFPGSASWFGQLVLGEWCACEGQRAERAPGEAPPAFCPFLPRFLPAWRDGGGIWRVQGTCVPPPLFLVLGATHLKHRGDVRCNAVLAWSFADWRDFCWIRAMSHALKNMYLAKDFYLEYVEL